MARGPMMRYLVLATDYDGTLATHGHVDEPVWAAIRRLRDSGRLRPVREGKGSHGAVYAKA